MKNISLKKVVLLIPILVLPFFLLEFSSCTNSTEPCESDTTSNDNGGPIYRKSNIYIYPQEEIELNVSLTFPNGGSVISSIPKYDNVWNIKVDSNGVINNIYKYLYYECTAPDLCQYEEGWSMHKDSLTMFFLKNLSQTGFSQREIEDFIDYWIPLLNSSEYYAIYPQYKVELSSIVEIVFSSQPDNLLRLFYTIKECAKDFRAPNLPIIPKFNRNGFYVVEWGVLIDGNLILN